MPEVSVVLPVYRTGDVFSELFDRLCAVLEERGASFEVIAINDACPDGSEAILRAVADQDARLRIVSLLTNVGQQRAVFAGISKATGSVIVVLDADLQDAPEDLPALLARLEAGGVEAVFAGRRGIYQRRSRMITSRIFKTLLSRLLRVPCDAGSFVAMSRRMAEAIIQYDGPNPYLLALIGGTRLPVASIPIARSTRRSGSSAYSLFGRLSFAARALHTALIVRTSYHSS